MKITICGGGSLGHICIGVLSQHSDVEIKLFTKSPNKWHKNITVNDINNKVYNGKISKISSNPSDVVAGSDIVFLCLPGFLIEETLKEIKPFISEKTIIGSIVSSTGFFFAANNVFKQQAKIFGFQRTPFIARINEYGKTANLLGYKPKVYIATENIPNTTEFTQLIEKLFITPTFHLNNIYEAALTNSNPILHTGRLYAMWHNYNGEIYNECGLFYKEWTDDASQIIVDMDNEFMCLLEKLNINKNVIPSLLTYYESENTHQLTEKIKSIKAFQTVLSPMKQTEKGWIPDFKSRYFMEDFPFGLQFIVLLAKEKHVNAPTINKVFEWGMNICNKHN